MVSIENFCTDCEVCINCGRKRVKVVTCDYCGQYLDNDTKLYHVAGNKMACMRCVVDLYIEEDEIKEIPFDDEYIYDGERYSFDDLADRLAEELDEVEV